MRLNLLKRQQTYFLLIFAKKIPANSPTKIRKISENDF
nr:MAG TPA: hypothetical protein [Caudoviricetes sp.]